jgi:predicted RNA-binding Zn ribbon-like protein
VNHHLRGALAAAHRAFALQEPVQVQPVRLPVRETNDRAVRRRLAGQTAVTLAPVSILAPAPDTDATVQEFVRAEFAEAQRKRERRVA